MRRLLTPRWLVGHLAVAATGAAFLALGWWQVRRAAAGNMLSYAYAVKWPVFAGFVVVVWVRQVLRVARGAGAGAGAGAGEPPPERITPKPPSRRPLPVPVEEPDPELAAYNRYLQWLAANPGRQPSEYPRACWWRGWSVAAIPDRRLHRRRGPAGAGVRRHAGEVHRWGPVAGRGGRTGARLPVHRLPGRHLRPRPARGLAAQADGAGHARRYRAVPVVRGRAGHHPADAHGAGHGGASGRHGRCRALAPGPQGVSAARARRRRTNPTPAWWWAPAASR